MIDDEKIDSAILKLCKMHYLKVARIVCDVCDDLGFSLTKQNTKAVAHRIAVLVEQGKLDGVGDLSEWRFSEVCLKQ